MPLIKRNDINQIFASQAPAQDTPPIFTQYTGGWGAESRPNNGKPTIKQFNKLQQRTDENVLYIHQNGAALPWMPDVEYALHATVTKSDGALVQSKIVGNTTNPNVDMEGWEKVVAGNYVSIWDFHDGGVFFDGSLEKGLYFLKAHGGGSINFPFKGDGVYRFNSSQDFEGFNNTSVVIDNGVKIDFSSVIGDSKKSIWNFSGSIGDEINLSENATRGGRKITVADASSLSEGDFLLLKSQRNALHPDGGPDWQLGVPTGYSYDTHACYYGEPLEIIGISGNVLSLSRPIIFPDYRIDATAETSTKARPCSTVQKIEFSKNIGIYGGEFVGGAGMGAVRATLCKDFSINSSANMQSADGHAFLNYLSLGTICDMRVRHDAKYYITVDHSRYNSVKDVSSWFSQIKLVDRYGVQCLDVTYMPNSVTGIGGTYDIRSYDSQEQGLTFHAGHYGWTIISAVVHRARQCGFTLRSRYGSVHSAHIMGRPENQNLAGIQLSQWATDINISSFYINGYNFGFSTGDTNTIDEPHRKNINISSGTIVEPITGFRLFDRGILTDDGRPSKELSGIDISAVKIIKPKSHGILIGKYLNGVSADISIDELRPDCFGVYCEANSFGHDLKIRIGSLKGGLAFRNIGITDRDTFPRETFAHQGIDLDIRVLDNAHGNQSQLNTVGMFGMIDADYSISNFDDKKTLYFNPSTPRTVTLRYHGMYGSVGVEVDIFNIGTADLTFVSDNPATVLQGISKLSPGGHIRVRRLTATTPVIWASV